MQKSLVVAGKGFGGEGLEGIGQFLPGLLEQGELFRGRLLFGFEPDLELGDLALAPGIVAAQLAELFPGLLQPAAQLLQLVFPPGQAFG